MSPTANARWASKQNGIPIKMSARLLIIWLSCISATACADKSESSKIKCAELGQKFSAEFKKDYVSDISIWGNPEFHYNSALGTCLVYTEVVDGTLNKDISSVWYYRRITDIYSNKVLAYSRYFIDKSDLTKKKTPANLDNVGDAVNLSSERFAVKKAELFRQ
jgi:hypothetical protein